MLFRPLEEKYQIKFPLKNTQKMKNRQIKFNGSDKMICNYFDNGYCRFKEECKFFHPNEICEFEKCDLQACIKRHPKSCKYFRRKKCKFNDACLFKHKDVENDTSSDNKDAKEAINLQNKLKHLEETIKNLRADNKQKDLDLTKKAKIIEKKDKDIKDLTEENLLLKGRVENVEKSKEEKSCQVCHNKFKTKLDLDCHIKDVHKLDLIRSKEFIARLQDISNNLVDEKKKHKQICKFSEKCPHEMSCNVDCFYLNTSYVESEAEETDDDDDNDSESDDDNVEITLDIQNKCSSCNFKSKSKSGLKMHEKSNHKEKCKSCEFKTTTKILLKQHAESIHMK